MKSVPWKVTEESVRPRIKAVRFMCPQRAKYCRSHVRYVFSISCRCRKTNQQLSMTQPTDIPHSVSIYFQKYAEITPAALQSFLVITSPFSEPQSPRSSHIPAHLVPQLFKCYWYPLQVKFDPATETHCSRNFYEISPPCSFPHLYLHPMELRQYCLTALL